MSDIFDGAEIENKIGYAFFNKSLLKQCFVHSSYTNEHKNEPNNERLEFLGDAVLELIFTEKLYNEGNSEGDMTSRRQKLVSDASLNETAKRLNLEKYLLVGGGEHNVGKKAVPSVVEALIAGIYLDGGYNKAREFALKNISPVGGQNYVGALQELMQSSGKPLPEYSLIVEASADGRKAEGSGSSKKQARMQAAKNLYCLIKNS